MRKTSLGQDHRTPGRQRWLWVMIAVLLLPALLFYARLAIIEPIQNWRADDLAINYSAATVLRSGGFIYDGHALRAAHEARVGPAGNLYSALFLTYNNTPATALLLSRCRCCRFTRRRSCLSSSTMRCTCWELV